MQVALVKFQDPTTHDHWASMDDIDKSAPKVCFACGFLIEESEEAVKVCLLLGQEKEIGSNWIVIPARCVLFIEVIKEIDLDV